MSLEKEQTKSVLYPNPSTENMIFNLRLIIDFSIKNLVSKG
jgi:hypothetical protein